MRIDDLWERGRFHYECNDFLLYTGVGPPPLNNVIKVVPSVLGGVGFIVIFVVCWTRCRRRRRNDENQPLLRDNVQNEFPVSRQGSELSSGRGSASLTKSPSTGSSCSDITVSKKDDLNNKIKPCAEVLC